MTCPDTHQRSELMTRTKIFALLLTAAAFALLLPGCGDKDKEKKRQDSALEKTAGLKKRFTQLSTTLDQLERETEIQKQKIGAARSELQAIRDMLANTRPKDLALAELATTGVVRVVEAEPIVAHSEATVSEEEKDAAQDSVFRTLVILLFLIGSAVFIGKLWMDRDKAASRSSAYGRPPEEPRSGQDQVQPPLT